MLELTGKSLNHLAVSTVHLEQCTIQYCMIHKRYCSWPQGWSLSMITQYDVELVQKIEELTGITMSAYEMEEGAVLKSITRVFKAKRTASMRIAEEKGFEGVKVGQRANHTKNKRVQQPVQT